MNKEEMQNIYKWVRIVLVVLAIFLGLQAIGVLKNLRNVDPVYNSISVTGEGEVVSVPDVASFSFGVSVEAKEVSDAQSQVTMKVNDILSELEELDIEDEDIKTTNYSIYPNYTYVSPGICSSTYCPPGRQVQSGYTVTQSISVKVRDTEKVGEALALVGERGATNVSSISFTIDDMDKVIEEARAEAIQNAREKAKTLAKELGVRLVRVISFYDNNGPIPYYAESLGGDFDRAVSLSAPTPRIPTGENKTVVNVTVVYEIR